MKFVAASLWVMALFAFRWCWPLVFSVGRVWTRSVGVTDLYALCGSAIHMWHLLLRTDLLQAFVAISGCILGLLPHRKPWPSGDCPQCRSAQDARLSVGVCQIGTTFASNIVWSGSTRVQHTVCLSSRIV